MGSTSNSENSDHPRQGQPKGDKRSRTRTKLLEAARALIRDKGYEQTTLDDIAQKAGMTTGAIYGNFKNRNDLFIELGHAYWAPIRPKVKPGSSFAEVMRAVAEATIAVLPDREATAIGRLTGLAYTLGHQEMQAKVSEITSQSYAFGAEWLRSVTKEGELPMPAEKLIPIVHALIEGLVLQRLLTPELVSDEIFLAAFGALVR
ncbi:MAG TPA: TetR/AcrR family transcriptional regulator [Candidatus Angelobacter sp.]|nr:TetR/AcrR family transcriptional regulator [Candidatus Angelobacter sp.]